MPTSKFLRPNGAFIRSLPVFLAEATHHPFQDAAYAVAGVKACAMIACASC